METIIRKIDKNNIDPEVIEEAGNILKNGGLVAFPTETFRMTSSVSWRRMSMGRASLAGAPPPKEIILGFVIAPNKLLTTLAV